MRGVIILLCLFLAVAAAAPTASAAPVTPLRPGELGTDTAVLGWINNYRVRHDLVHVPEAIKALSTLGAFRDPGAAGVYVGFFAGVIGSNPKKADELIAKSLSIPAEDQWAIVEAIAYSGLPDWKDLLRKFGARMPSRKVMIEKFLADKLKTLDQMEFEKNVNMWQKFTGYFDFSKHMPGSEPARVDETYDASTTVLDTLWGYYFATSDPKPIVRIIAVLPWSKDHDHVEKLTIGGTAKLTLASNAVRDGVLLGILKGQAAHQPKPVAEVLNDVIDAAETAQTERIRKEVLADIDELKRKGSLTKRETVWWGQAGEVALAGVCVVSAALGAITFGLPCVIGGGVSAAALQYYSNQQ
jgi:hypothetical protein